MTEGHTFKIVTVIECIIADTCDIRGDPKRSQVDVAEHVRPDGLHIRAERYRGGQRIIVVLIGKDTHIPSVELLLIRSRRLQLTVEFDGRQWDW